MLIRWLYFRWFLRYPEYQYYNLTSLKIFDHNDLSLLTVYKTNISIQYTFQASHLKYWSIEMTRNTCFFFFTVVET